MDLPVKPACYDDVPACLCTSCQLYDAVCAESSSVSSSFLPARYADAVYSSPADPCEVSSVLSTRPSCSVAESTCGLASTVPPRRPCRPRRRRFEFAVSSPPFMLPVSSAVSSSSVPSGSVLPSPVSPVQTSVAASSSLPLSTPVSSVSSRARPVPPSRPFRAAVPPFRPVVPPPRLVSSPLLLPRPPLFPVVCFVLVAVPVLLPSPFGLVLSFLPLLR